MKDSPRTFSWKCVHHFRLVEGVLEPCDVYGELLPAPAIIVRTQEDKGFWGVWGRKAASRAPKQRGCGDCANPQENPEQCYDCGRNKADRWRPEGSVGFVRDAAPAKREGAK